MIAAFGRYLRQHHLGFLALVIAVGAAGSIAIGAIPSSSGVITGCYDKSGLLRVIDKEAGSQCADGETELSWNQQGPAGAPGQQGPAGPKGDTGPRGPAGSSAAGGIYNLRRTTPISLPQPANLPGRADSIEIPLSALDARSVGLRLDVPAGRYFLLATGLISAVTSEAPSIRCALYAGNELVETSEWQMPGSDGRRFHTTVLSGPARLTANGRVSLKCARRYFRAVANPRHIELDHAKVVAVRLG